MPPGPGDSDSGPRAARGVAFLDEGNDIRALSRLPGARDSAFPSWRPGKLEVDDGNARTLAYSFSLNPRVAMQLEWMEIGSSRDLWPNYYGLTTRRQTESMLQLGFRVTLFDSTSGPG